jgi:hypothetical protein
MWMKMTKASSRTALRDLEELIAAGVIEQEETGGRSTSYRLMKRIVEGELKVAPAGRRMKTAGIREMRPHEISAGESNRGGAPEAFDYPKPTSRRYEKHIQTISGSAWAGPPIELLDRSDAYDVATLSLTRRTRDSKSRLARRAAARLYNATIVKKTSNVAIAPISNAGHWGTTVSWITIA